MVSHDNIGFYLLSQEVAQHVRVVQSGQGADEVFAGYHWYPPMLGSNDALADYSRVRSEEHTSELQSLMRISYAVFCLQKKTQKKHTQTRKSTSHMQH